MSEYLKRSMYEVKTESFGPNLITRTSGLVESTGFCLLIIAHTSTHDHIYTYVNSQYLQHVMTEAARDVTSARLHISKNTTKANL